MNTHNFGFYHIVGEDGVRAIIDEANEQYNNASWKGNFEWDIPQMALTFNVLTAQSNIAPMASLINVNSPKPLRSTTGFGGYGGAIPKLGHGFNVEEQGMRDQLLIAGHGGSINEDIFAELLFNSADRLISGAHSRINYMADQIISTGKLIIDVDNNPDGMLLSVDFRVPDENFLKTGFANAPKLAWSDPLANPIQDLIDMVSYADDHNIVYDQFEMSKALWNRFIQHKSVLDWVRARKGFSTSAPNYPVGRDEIYAALEGFGLPPIKVIDHKYAVEQDGFEKTLKGYNEENVILKPAGIIGKVKNAISMHTLAPSSPDNFRSSIEGNRIALLNQWDAAKMINHIELEGYAIPTLNNPKNLLILNTTEATA